MHNQQLTPGSSQAFTLLLEFSPEQVDERDPAFIHAIGRDTVEALQKDHITVQPVYTGQQGGDFLVEIVTAIGQLASSAWNHRTIIEEVMNDSSTLVALASFICTIIKKVKQSYEKHVGHEESVAKPISLTFELDGASLTVESLNPALVKDLLVELVQQSQKARASMKTPSSDTLKIRSKIPRKRKGGKR